MHLYSLALLACRGRLWHWQRKAIIATEHKRQPGPWRLPPPGGVCAVVVMALVVWSPMADQGGLQILLVLLKAGAGAGIIVLLLLLLLLVSAVIPAVGEMGPRSFRTERGCPVAVEENTARAGSP